MADNREQTVRQYRSGWTEGDGRDYATGWRADPATVENEHAGVLHDGRDGFIEKRVVVYGKPEKISLDDLQKNERY